MLIAQTGLKRNMLSTSTSKLAITSKLVTVYNAVIFFKKNNLCYRKEISLKIFLKCKSIHCKSYLNEVSYPVGGQQRAFVVAILDPLVYVPIHHIVRISYSTY